MCRAPPSRPAARLRWAPPTVYAAVPVVWLGVAERSPRQSAEAAPAAKTATPEDEFKK